ANKQPHGFSYFCGECISSCQSIDPSVKDNIVGAFIHGFLHAEIMKTRFAALSGGIEVALHDVIFFVYRWQSAAGLDKNEAIHARSYVHPHRCSCAVIDIQSGINRLEREYLFMSWCNKRRFGAASRTSHRMQVDIVGKFVIGVILKVKLDLVAKSGADKGPWHGTSKGPEEERYAVGDFRFLFNDRHFDNQLPGCAVTNRLRNQRWRCQYCLHSVVGYRNRSIVICIFLFTAICQQKRNEYRRDYRESSDPEYWPNAHT